MRAKKKTCLVESGKWHSKENQLIKYPRRPPKGVTRRDSKQRSIKSFCVKLAQKSKDIDKENYNIKCIQEVAPILRDSNLFSVGCNNFPTVSVPRSSITHNEQIITKSESHYKPATITLLQPSWTNTGRENDETMSAVMRTASTQSISPPLDVLEGFCPMHTSTQISDLYPAGHIESQNRPSSSKHEPFERSRTIGCYAPYTHSGDASCETSQNREHPAEGASCYNLSVRFTQDSEGNSIFCHLSQKGKH